jgi:putative DNA methylase
MTVKKLIEVALPLEKINEACAVEKQPFTRKHPRSIHIWWARRPLAIARAVIFAQMVDDPSSHPERFPTEEAQEVERQRLFQLIEQLVLWENTTNEEVLQAARTEIWRSWRDTCAENADHPRAAELFNPEQLPGFHDPFAGGGSLPLEAQRLGLESYASDLNPVAVLINKALIEIPPKFAGQPPINPTIRKDRMALDKHWSGAQGLAEDIRYYGQWMRDEAEKRIGHLYPKIEVTAAMAADRAELKSYVGQQLTVIAWLWARTVKSPNPAFAHVDVPLASTFMLSTKAGKEAYVEPVVEGDSYRFNVKTGKPQDVEAIKNGTKLSRGAHFRCVLSNMPIASEHIYGEANAGRMGSRLMAIVAEGDRGRVYLAPTAEQEAIAHKAQPEWQPDVAMPENPRWFSPPLYGLQTYGDLFTSRQLIALHTFYEMINEVRELAYHDALSSSIDKDTRGIDSGGSGITAYTEALALYLAVATSRWSDLSNSICGWNHTNQNVRALFARQSIPMSWDYAELSPFSKVGSWFSTIESALDILESLPSIPHGIAIQDNASRQTISNGKLISTDPPYYDNIGYADLSDFFYVWLRRSLKGIFPTLFSTVTVPKADELVADPYRHGGKIHAEHFFLEGMTHAMEQLSALSHIAFPVTIYYAFKQSENDGVDGTASTGWETFLDAVIRAGFAISGTWPVRTERKERSVSIGTNALASSIVLVCRRRSDNAPIATRRDFLAALRAELPIALAHLQRGNIAPVDLAQASIGPGMAVFTRYSKVLDAAGNAISVREALTLINQTLDEVLAKQEGDFDADTRWALNWFEQYGFTEGEYGVADTLSRAKNTSVAGMAEGGILFSRAGKVRLLRPEELPADWDPATDERLSVWEMVHQLVRALSAGETAAADLAARIGPRADVARELAYRLYVICERKKRAAEALAYNSLVQSWTEMQRLAQAQPIATVQANLFEGE